MNIGAGTAIKAIIFFVIIGIMINDAAAIATNYWLASATAQEIASKTANAYRNTKGNKDATLNAAYQLCRDNQSRLTGYTLENNIVVVEIETGPKKTIVVHYIGAFKPYLSGKATARSSLD